MNLIGSRVGRALRAIHGNEDAAAAMGVDVARYKLAVFVLSAVYAAVGGACLVHYNGGIGPGEAGVMKSVRYVALVAAGGMGSPWGTVVGLGGAHLPLAARRVRAVRRRGLRRASSWRSCSSRPDGLFGLVPPRSSRGMSEVNLLEVQDLHHWFGGLHVIDEVSFSCRPGIVKAIIGPNGAGKTTLFNLVAGTLPPVSGAITFEGRGLSGLPPHRVAARGDHPHLPGHAPVPPHERAGERDGGHARAGAPRLPRRRWPAPVATAARGDARARARAWRCSDTLGIADLAGRDARACPSAASGWWRSRAPWPRSRGCCSWTSRPAA